MEMNVTSFAPHRSDYLFKHRKEKHFVKEIAVIDLPLIGEARAAIVVRFYSTPNLDFCCIWLNGQNASGSARAGGYGYHKQSQAFEGAAMQAGFLFDTQIGGVGDQAIMAALYAIARHIGLTRFYIHTAHA